jgi:hypothetical protein
MDESFLSALKSIKNLEIYEEYKDILNVENNIAES